MKSLLLISIFFYTNTIVLSQSAITFNKTYGGAAETLYNIIEIDDGYLAVNISNYSVGYAQYCVFKTNFNGDIVWQKYYGTTDEVHFNYSILPLTQGNFITGTYCYNTISKQNTIELLKIDSLGDSIWKKSIFAPPGFGYYGSYMIQTSDGGFLISGQIADSLITDGDGFILKTDSLGNEQWHSVYGGNNFDNLFSSVQLLDDSYLSLGWTRSYGAGDRDWYLVKTDSTGNFLWQKTFGSNNLDSPVGITSTSDSTYLLAGGGWLGSNNFYGRVIKIDTSGAVLNLKNYTGFPASEFWWIKPTLDGNYVGVGSNELLGFDNGWMVKLDTSLNLLWSRSFRRGNNHGYFRDVQPTTDGGYIAAGFCFQGASGGQDAWLVKLDSLGCDSVGCATYTTSIDDVPMVKQNGLSVFPNPAKEFITLSFSQPMFSVCQIRVFDIMGKEVFNQIAFIQKQYSIPVRLFPNGVYVVEVLREGKKEYSKFIKQ